MALRKLAVKLRIPASPARRFLSGTRDSAEPGCRNLPFSDSVSDHTAVAKEWYMLQRGRHDDLNRELANLRRIVFWTEELEHFLRGSYKVTVPLATGFVVLEWYFKKTVAAERKEAKEDARKQAKEAASK
ncbi:uncharacterized protein LOC124691057 [Lolium rigidum]|uniref:uncharacterized protein LOC124691057 n=1 Tax=Lolium rigidum TaxID=89674 RepID=UPI001F5CCB4A|nr:uncharacterized protein LOC124691057 [Lolium rigidum]